MESAQFCGWKQIHLPDSIEAVTSVSIDKNHTKSIVQRIDCHQSIPASLAQPEQPVREENICAHPVQISKELTRKLEEFHQALAFALNHIVERWGGLDGSGFNLSDRMPLMRQEEELIQWMHHVTKEGHMPPFRARAGHWRPNILLSTHKEQGLSFHVCEINARFISMIITSSLQMFRDLAIKALNAPGVDTVDPDKLAANFCSIFKPNVPLHFVRKRHDPSDAGPMLALLEAWTGTRVSVITPDDLYLVPDKTSFTGYRLCADTRRSTAQVMEQVHQAALDLYQDELRSMDGEVLKHLALCSINDMREIFLLANKRILGIVLQELDDLVHKYRVLTLEQAKILQDHIVPTILPGSTGLDRLINDSLACKTSKDNYLVKSCRNGASENIFFGDEYSIDEWNVLLTDLKDPRVHPDKLQFIIQPNIRSKFKVFLNEEHGVCDVYLVGLYHSFNGKFSHVGHWRISPDSRLCSDEQGGAVFVLPSVTESG